MDNGIGQSLAGGTDVSGGVIGASFESFYLRRAVRIRPGRRGGEAVGSPFGLGLVLMGMTNQSLMAVPLSTCLVLGIVTLIAGGDRAYAQANQAPPAPSAQVPPDDAGPQTVQVPSGEEAQRVRTELTRLLRQYSPILSQILQRDPSLMQRADYMTPYPGLVAFLEEHPEVVRNPSFYFTRYGPRRNSQERAQDLLEGVLAGLAVFTGVGIFIAVIAWLVRGVIDQRRWSRLLATQVALHTKLTDRLTTNDEVLNYIKIPAVTRFLESGPLALGGQASSTGAPISRMVWSLQAGVVLFTLGLGLWLVQHRVMEEVAAGFGVTGTIVMMVGVGFAASAVIAYLVSVRLGLLSREQS